jgi:hypothetical protein
VLRRGKRRAPPLDEQQLLLPPAADRDDQPPAIGQLLRQRIGTVGEAVATMIRDRGALTGLRSGDLWHFREVGCNVGPLLFPPCD